LKKKGGSGADRGEREESLRRHNERIGEEISCDAIFKKKVEKILVIVWQNPGFRHATKLRDTRGVLRGKEPKISHWGGGDQDVNSPKVGGERLNIEVLPN